MVRDQEGGEGEGVVCCQGGGGVDRERVWCDIKDRRRRRRERRVWCLIKEMEGGQGAMDKKVGVCMCICVPPAHGLMMVCLVLSMVHVRGDEGR